MGWEWRYFVRLPPAADSDDALLAGCREDVYFPAGDGAGLKLRNGEGELEVKLRKATRDIEGRGCAENWKKRCFRDCVLDAAGAVDGPRLDLAACVACASREFGFMAERVGGSKPVSLGRADIAQVSAAVAGTSRVRVRCRKRRTHTQTGERTECVFLVDDAGAAAAAAAAAVASGGGGGAAAAPPAPLTIERWLSVSIEVEDKEALRQLVLREPLPEGAIITGYPGIIAHIARCTLALHVCVEQTDPTPPH